MNDAMDGGNDDQNMDALQRSQPALGMAAVGDEASSFQHNWRDHGNLVDNRLDDDDEDNWSRQVETDESSVVHHPTGMGGGGGGESLLHYADDSVAHLGSVVEEGDNDALVATGDRGEEEEDEDDDVDDTSSSAQRAAPPPPSHPELTLKERLVLRERQRRIETERARWKRQFALNNGGGDSVGDDGVGGGGGVIDGDRDSDDNRDGDRDDDLQRGAGADGLEGGHGDDAASSSVMMGGGGHVSGGGGGGGGSATEGTLGEESTRAHPDHDHPSNQETLGFNMERFLRNSVTFDPQLDTAGTGATAGGSGDNGPPPLLERFLNEPVVIEPPGEGGASDSHPRSFDGSDRDGADGASMVPDDDGDVPPEAPVPPESFVSFGDGTNASTNASVVVEADEEDVARDPLTPLASMDAQDASSILAHGIGGIGEDDEDSPRLDEPRVLRLTEADMQEMAAIEEASIGNAPPSEREEETLSDIGELADFGGGGGQVLRDPSGNFSQGTATTAVESASLVSAGNHSAPQASSSGHPDAQNLDGFLNQLDEETHPDGLPVVVSAAAEGSGDNLYESAAARMPPTIGDPDRRSEDDCRTSPLLTNRVLRPGMVAIPPHLGLSAARFGGPHEALVVDGFDFDKDAPTSPLPSARGDDSFRDLPMDVWSPPGKMHVSPISFKGVRALPSTDEEETPAIPYMEADARVPGPPPAVVGGDGGRMFRAVSAPTPVAPDEGTPLLIDFPPDIRSSLRESTRSRRFSIVSIGSIFSDVRSEEDGSKEEIQNESEFYLRSSILSRGT